MPMLPGYVQMSGYPAQYGAGFFGDFVKGFTLPFKAVNSVLPGAISTLAGAVHPGLGIGAKMLGLGRKKKRRGTRVVRI